MTFEALHTILERKKHGISLGISRLSQTSSWPKREIVKNFNQEFAILLFPEWNITVLKSDESFNRNIFLG
jgi:hypothetical protein